MAGTLDLKHRNKVLRMPSNVYSINSNGQGRVPYRADLLHIHLPTRQLLRNPPHPLPIHFRNSARLRYRRTPRIRPMRAVKQILHSRRLARMIPHAPARMTPLPWRVVKSLIHGLIELLRCDDE